MSTPRIRFSRLVLAGLALPLGGLAALTSASPAGALEPHVLSIQGGAVITEEDGGFLTLELSDGPADADIDFTVTSNLQYSYTDATDFTAVDVLGTLPAGQTAIQVPVLPFDDDLIEGFEQFYVGITSISGPAVGGAKVTASLHDEERAYLAITLGDAEVSELSVAEGDDADTVVPVTVHVSTPLANDQSVGVDALFGGGCTTIDGNDASNFDNGTIEIKAGAHKAQGSIIVHGDTMDELDECANVWVSAYDMNMFHEMGDNSAELTILDDDDTILSDAPDEDGPQCDPQVEVCDVAPAPEPTDPEDAPEIDDEVPADEVPEVEAEQVTPAAETGSLPRTGAGTTEVLAAAGLALVATGTVARRAARRLS